jgi:hypothetical protein
VSVSHPRVPSGSGLVLRVCLAAVLAACGGAVTRARPPASVFIQAAPRIVTPTEVTTEAGLRSRGMRAMAEQRWQVAADAFAVLTQAASDSAYAADDLFNLGLSLEGEGLRKKARDTFVELAHRFPDRPSVTSAIVRAASLDAYLEDWPALVTTGQTLLDRGGLTPVEKVVALGSRGLGRVEQAQDASASRDILDGLELADGLHYGARDVLPVAVAQLYFALGELRRQRSERFTFASMPANFKDNDFLGRLDARCAGLLDAQAAYANAVRSVDPHWAEMAGFRVGEMYRALHDDLMQIAPPDSSTSRKRDIFYAFMHVRYRVLLEKGLREMEQTVSLAERTNDASPWLERARAVRDGIKVALSEEKERIHSMPFTEVEVKKALDLLAVHSARSGS